MKLAQVGAGNIGRSFIGQLFSRAGYEVVFIDVDDALVKALNERREYVVEIRDVRPEAIVVKNVRAVNARDVERSAEEIATADVAATAVGQSALAHVYPTLARALVRRAELALGPLDIIICENARNVAQIVAAGLRRHLPPGFPLDERVGLVETSIGKMVPIIGEEERARDPVRVFAEAYNTLIVDRPAFKCGVPAVPGIDARENMKAYVDRKLFIHNLGHATLGYLAHLVAPEMVYTYEAVGDADLLAATRAAMWESGRALMKKYPAEFNEANQGEHIEDLLRRFGNRALGDTIFRVGRDMARKLSPQDRLIGALRLDAEEGVASPWSATAAAAALFFRGKDEQGRMFEGDRQFIERLEREGAEALLRDVCGLGDSEPMDRIIREQVLAAYQRILEAKSAGRVTLRAIAPKGGA